MLFVWGEGLNECLIHSPKSVHLSFLNCSELPCLSKLCDLRIFCQLSVLSLSRSWFLSNLVASGFNHACICGKRLKGILMQISRVTSLFSSSSLLHYNTNCCHLSSPKLSSQYSLPSGITAVCRMLQGKKKKKKRQGEFEPLLIYFPSFQGSLP